MASPRKLVVAYEAVYQEVAQQMEIIAVSDTSDRKRDS